VLCFLTDINIFEKGNAPPDIGTWVSEKGNAPPDIRRWISKKGNVEKLYW